MTLIICVSDFWKKPQYYQLYPVTNENPVSYEIELLQKLSDAKQFVAGADPLTTTASSRRTLRRKQVSIDGIQLHYFIKELLFFKEYRRVLCTAHLLGSGVQLFWLQTIQPSRDVIDWKWNHMLARKLWEKIETDYLMSWLSTLGGGYSALGEQFSNCAEVAGKISQKQLRIGIQLGDPFLQSRCLLYYSISLIQVGRLRTAKYIIRNQYAFARANEEIDGRLVKMCEGIWMRLEYEYGLRSKKKGKKQ